MEAAARRRSRDRARQLARAAARHPLRRQGYLRHRRRAHLRTLANLHRRVSRARTATAVARLRAAGAVLMGKLATHEFAHGGPSFDLPWPPARNPWNTAHFTGGSSSGSGAAIAAGLVRRAWAPIPADRSAAPPACAASPGSSPPMASSAAPACCPTPTPTTTAGRWRGRARTARSSSTRSPATIRPIPASALQRPGGLHGRPDAGHQGHAHRRRAPLLGQGPARVRRAAGRAGDRDLACCASSAPSVEDVTLRPLHSYSDVKIVAAESELFSLHLPELIARPEQFGQDFRARSLAACLFTAEDYVRASRERRAILAEMRPLYRRYDLFLTANTSAAPAPRPARYPLVLDAAEPDLAVQLHRRAGAGRAVRLHARRPAALAADRRPTVRRCPRAAGRPCLRAGDRPLQAPAHACARREGRPPSIPSPGVPTRRPSSRRCGRSPRTPRCAAGLRLPGHIMEELVAVAPWALAMARRLNRHHPREAETASIFDPGRDID